MLQRLSPEHLMVTHHSHPHSSDCLVIQASICMLGSTSPLLPCFRYTPTNFSLPGLKGRDQALVGLLTSCPHLEVVLALVHRCVGVGGGRRRGFTGGKAWGRLWTTT
jgi:hypothetical protein